MVHFIPILCLSLGTCRGHESLKAKNPSPKLGAWIYSSGHSVSLDFTVQINMGNERPESETLGLFLLTTSAVSLNKYLLSNVKGLELTLVFLCH